MSDVDDTEDTKVGTLAWRDLTVPDAETVRDFYKSVVGWGSQETVMDGYSDFSMIVPGTGEAVAGICHARGTNADLPPQWLMYVVVADLDRSMHNCAEGGGELIDGPRPLGQGRFCVIRDPAGAVCALYQP
jgi:predicted enzyme related to lactoylglutathione lyase